MRKYRSRRPYTQVADLDGADCARRWTYRLSSATPRSKGTLASNFVGNVSELLPFTDFTPRSARQQNSAKMWLFGWCVIWGLHFLNGMWKKCEFTKHFFCESNFVASPCRDTQDAKHLRRLLVPQEPNVRLCIPHRRKAANGY